MLRIFANNPKAPCLLNRLVLLLLVSLSSLVAQAQGNYLLIVEQINNPAGQRIFYENDPIRFKLAWASNVFGGPIEVITDSTLQVKNHVYWLKDIASIETRSPIMLFLTGLTGSVLASVAILFHEINRRGHSTPGPSGAEYFGIMAGTGVATAILFRNSEFVTEPIGPLSGWRLRAKKIQ